ncbi:preprotein translocase subunit SecG [Candidatus Gracilibacteria bacterium]|nr:preprotein translocase subunit SecG [Thermales bacterium]NJL96339.1 preprotein translocase subunit SecG [Candidatus Gracilibacteria bacterium]
MPLSEILLLIQVFSLVMSIILILMQNRGAGLSSTFGGGGDIYLTRRGIEKSIVGFTVFFIVLFIVVRLASLYV